VTWSPWFGVANGPDGGGGDDGSAQPAFLLDPGEVVTEIQTQQGDVDGANSVTMITIQTSAGREVSYGTPSSDDPVVWAFPAGDEAWTGAWGSFGNWLDGWAALIGPFAPATWGKWPEVEA
jgi:hypothetical protein